MTPETISITVALISVLMVAINKIGLYFYDPTSRKSDALSSSKLDASETLNTKIKIVKGSIEYVAPDVNKLNLPSKNNIRGRIVRIMVADGKVRKLKSKSIIQKSGDFSKENLPPNLKESSES